MTRRAILALENGTTFEGIAIGIDGQSVGEVVFKGNLNQQDLVKNLHQIIENNSIERFEYLYPDEYRLDKQLKEFCDELSIENEVLDSEHFYTSRTELKVFFEGKKQYLMENFHHQRNWL